MSSFVVGVSHDLLSGPMYMTSQLGVEEDDVQF